MGVFSDIRNDVAAAVSTVTPCQPYPPDTLAPPLAWVDAFQTDVAGNQTFCDLGNVSGSVVVVNTRNDTASGMQQLEDQIPEIIKALEDADFSVTGVQSGTADIGGMTLLAITYSFDTTI